MNHSEFLPIAISRRSAIQNTLLGLGAYFTGITGCNEHGSAPARPTSSPDVSEFQDLGYRLYGIVVKLGANLDVPALVRMNLRLLPVHWQRGTTLRAQSQPSFHHMVWATVEEAKQLSQMPEIEAVFEKQPEHIMRIGSAKEARPADTTSGMLAVKLLPTIQSSPQFDRPFASTGQIVQAWRDATRDIDGITINPGPASVIPESGVGDVAQEGQILVRFSAPTLDPRVIRMIENHPQVIAIRWGSIFTNLYCPPCGMG